MDKKITKIDVVFENCDFATIPAEHIENISIYDTKESWVYHNGQMEQCFNCKKVYLQFSNAANVPMSFMCGDTNTKFFNRAMAYGDITSIVIYYDDGTDRLYYVPWKDEEYSGEINQYQITGIVNRHLCIGIGKNIDSLFYDKFDLLQCNEDLTNDSDNQH